MKEERRKKKEEGRRKRERWEARLRYGNVLLGKLWKNETISSQFRILDNKVISL
jgi:hypothetical protein